ncbi:MAG: 50S ribosomal protein L10 [Candidatus Helarchaeota archaeon]
MAVESKQIPEFKIQEVKQLKDLIDEYPVICLANMHKLGAQQLQSIRKKLAGKIIIRMTKNRLFKIAAKQSSKKNIQEFIETIMGSTSYIFTKMNPFKLKLFLDKNKVNAPAKGGDIAQNDIIVPEGNTGFPPGPMISELKEVGIDSMVKQGSIYIKKDTVVVKKGEEVSRHMAIVLSRLNIQPMEIGLNLYAAYDDGFILKEEDLEISLEDILNQLQAAIQNGLRLSVEIAFPTKENISLLLQKAHMHAKSLVISAGIITKDTIGEVLAKARMNALSIASKIFEIDPEALPAELKQQINVKKIQKVKPEEKKKEKVEKKEEEAKDLGLGGLFG